MPCFRERRSRRLRQPEEQLLQRLVPAVRGDPEAQVVQPAVQELPAAVQDEHARAQVLDKTKGQFPAPVAAVEAIFKGCNLPLDEGLRMETELFVPLVGSQASGDGSKLARENTPTTIQVPPSLVDELRTGLRQYLPEYMVPSAFIFLPALPLTPNGKADRKALPLPEGPSVQPGADEPTTPMEQQLASMWREVLGLKQVGIRDNFFDLGGHSLMAFQLISRIRETTSGGCSTRRGSRRGSTLRRSSSSCSSSATG